MKMKHILNLSFVLMMSLLAYSCGDDDEMTPDPVDPCESINATYNGDVVGIINSSCAYVGCHNGDNSGIPNYSSYAGFVDVISDGTFETRVLVERNMPNPDSTPDDRPQELTADQLAILQCWADAGFPEG